MNEILAIKEACQTEGFVPEESQRKTNRDISLALQAQYDKIPDTNTLESQIDSLVYQLYNLTNEEIKIVENK
ncbi:hypothetical protein [Helicobacter mesocricetorum]|uniref:hypothetical protein n=1 Tax=Helicobacter mesocricetorum TaxID=87012 RepID=UPI000CF0BD1B|nr:hypothetical protein [Helicobacter mesocricetorum]